MNTKKLLKSKTLTKADMNADGGDMNDIEKADEGEESELDYNNLQGQSTEEQFAMDMGFSLEEDMVNLGICLQLNHPRFFEGGRGCCRYIFWLINALLILVIQAVFIVKFNLQSLEDTIGPS